MPMLSWPEIHGAATHFPVALLIAGLAFDAGALIFRKPEWRVVGFWMLVVAVVMAVPSIIAGLMTANDLYGGPARPPDVFFLHRNAAFLTAALAIAVLAWRVVAKDRLTGGARYGSLLLSAAAAGTVGYVGYLGGHMVFGDESQNRPTNPEIRAEGRPSEGAAEPVDTPAPELVARGQKLFTQEDMACMNCHAYQGKGGAVAPDLTRVGREHSSLRWHIEHLKDPAKVHPGSTMPSYDSLPEADLEALAAFLATRR